MPLRWPSLLSLVAATTWLQLPVAGAVAAGEPPRARAAAMSAAEPRVRPAPAQLSLGLRAQRRARHRSSPAAADDAGVANLSLANATGRGRANASDEPESEPVSAIDLPDVTEKRPAVVPWDGKRREGGRRDGREEEEERGEPGVRREGKAQRREPVEFLGLPKLLWALIFDILAMLAFIACIPFILTVAKRRRPPAAAPPPT